ncbi:DUF5668 domain-containing protein [uncultured Mucilaginibacter sp.]|uniref:LiaI-LiaF-like domain-containing protein n=1 Tax=uncultured Mucilaginibacter sp. TaxID=797541 RepID=UPI0025E9FF34|nr:DUF5668 domain-containing protein [uncultured Mucilaginibacter sp.]
MKSDRLFSGLVLVIIGVVFLLNSFNIIHFSWWNIWKLWPIFLVIGGVNLLLSNTKAAWAVIVKVLVLVIGVGLIVYSGTRPRNQSLPGWQFNFDDNDNDDDSDRDGDVKSTRNSNTYSEAFVAGTKVARLEIAGGGTTYELKDTTNDLFHAEAREHFGDYGLSTTKEDSITVVDFSMSKHNQKFNFGDGGMNKVSIGLNLAPVWDIELKGGAAEIDFDLTKFKVRNVDINGGATSTDIKLAANMPVTNVSVHAGASETKIMVPKNAGCDIEMHGGLTSKHFDDFTKVSNTHYVTPGFENATNKIYLKLKGGVSEFRVERY